MNDHRVLVVDDKKIIRESIAKFVENEVEGFTVGGCFSDGREAIDFICENQIEVIITDVKMRDVSGIDLAKYIYENNLNIEVIIISAYKYFEYARQALEYGVKNYLLKPTSPIELENALGKIKVSLEKKELDHMEKQEKNMEEDMSKEAINQKDEIVIKKAINYIKKNYMRKLSLQEVAKSVYLSEFYFSKLFKKIANKSFTDYLVEIRMEKALELLRGDEYKVYEISKLVGYESNYFVKVFKNYTGYTPSEYFLYLENLDE